MEQQIKACVDNGTEIDWDAWTIEKLQSRLTTLGLSPEGNKLTLILRLLDYVNKHGPECLDENFQRMEIVSDEESDEEEHEGDFVIETKEDGEEIKRPTRLQFATDLISSEKSRTVRLFPITSSMLKDPALQEVFSLSESFILRFCPAEPGTSEYEQSADKKGIAELRFRTFLEAETTSKGLTKSLFGVTVKHLKSSTKGVMRYWDNQYETEKSVHPESYAKRIKQSEDAAIRTVVLYCNQNIENISEETIAKALNLQTPFSIYLPRNADRRPKGYLYVSFDSSKAASALYETISKNDILLDDVQLKATLIDGVIILDDQTFELKVSGDDVNTDDIPSSFSAAGEMLPHPELLSEKRRAKMEQMVRNLHGKLKEIQGKKNDETISSTKKKLGKLQQKLLLDKALKMNMGTWSNTKRGNKKKTEVAKPKIATSNKNLKSNTWQKSNSESKNVINKRNRNHRGRTPSIGGFKQRSNWGQPRSTSGFYQSRDSYPSNHPAISNYSNPNYGYSTVGAYETNGAIPEQGFGRGYNSRRPANKSYNDSQYW
ncbi:DgyrCDS12699 [Dimorphilus gyrociliatus]|uniref:DgyrCDS12699 n=1 Tax=Dimorphilus gyrociliatus TaxID=2664684 RepID=A0A7I8W7B4_9ANNE|nr:DgyrCDS12699 [Dimorphilus gyrociliatus]